MKIVRTQLKHQRIEAEIRQLVRTLPLGAKLPAERDLAVTYGCNFLTVRKALKQMVDDGSIIRRVGSGTFVARNQEVGETASSRGGKIVGMMVYQESNAYAYRVVQAIAHAGLEQDVDLRSGWVRDFGEEALTQAQQFQKDGCTALTLPWFPHEKSEEVRGFVQRCPLPVSLAMLIPGLEKNCFTQPQCFGTSTSVAIEDICHYYTILGHQRIALIGPDSASDVLLQKRLSAYACYTSRENLPNLCGLVGPGAQAMDQLAERWKGYQGDLAIISYDDEHALRFMTAMHKIGLSAPEDYNIIGYNDTEASRYSDPPLSTIHQNFEYIGHWLLKSALGLAQDEICQSPDNPRPIMLVRSTCGGRGKIDAALRLQLSGMDVTVEANGHSPEKELAAAGTR
ncbi:MAG: substrate-binding domain-containing protein [Chthoniobacteraceae bacterium]|nr:substrate-binding domain-containing protein [Chthoniobacteraceae bacterium]